MKFLRIYATFDDIAKIPRQDNTEHLSTQNTKERREKNNISKNYSPYILNLEATTQEHYQYACIPVKAFRWQLLLLPLGGAVCKEFNKSTQNH